MYRRCGEGGSSWPLAAAPTFSLRVRFQAQSGRRSDAPKNVEASSFLRLANLANAGTTADLTLTRRQGESEIRREEHRSLQSR